MWEQNNPSISEITSNMLYAVDTRKHPIKPHGPPEVKAKSGKIAGR